MWKPSLRPSGAGSEKLSWFFQDPGLGEGFLALKGSLGDSGRFRCVWPPEEIFFFFFLLYKEVAQLSSAQLRRAGVCPAGKQAHFI